MAKVKISGLANYNDALDATNLGANFLSFDFFKESLRRVSEKLFLDITSKLPPFINFVAVFADVEEKYIIKTIKKCSIKNVQFNDDISPEFCKSIKESQNIKIFKYFKVNQESDILKFSSYKDSIDYFILNISCENGQICKTKHDIILKIMDLKVPVFIDVTTNFDDIKNFIKSVNPYGFDAGSLIERLTKRKDYDKMNTFIKTSCRF
ncbi:MAG: phosphoribosylanthranilate isomerase [Endomicrobium sp.]|jgi:phosphoribosylanthranilate isomerase|nr:phosphoribosylanthranilate isomerase [Endomicrobium sp.]